MFAFPFSLRRIEGDQNSASLMAPYPALPDEEVHRSRAESGRTNTASRFLSLVSTLLARVPLRIGHRIANGLAWPHYLLFPARRRAVLANLAILRPAFDCSRTAPRSAPHDGALQPDDVRVLPTAAARRATSCSAVSRSTGCEHLKQALARGRGVILTSCHVGNWELGAVVVALMGRHVHAVAGVQLGRWLTGAVRETKNELAIPTVAPEDGFRKLFRALETQRHSSR